MSRPPTPGGSGSSGGSGGLGGTGDLNSTLHHGSSTMKFLKYSRHGTPAVTLDRNADLNELGDDYEEVDYNVEDILRVSEKQQQQNDKTKKPTDSFSIFFPSLFLFVPVPVPVPVPVY